MTKYLLIALAVLVLVAGAFAKIEYDSAAKAKLDAQRWQESSRNAEQALSKAQEQVKLTQATSLARQQELNRLRQQSEVQQKALNDALKANPDWASAPVPDSVWDSLEGPPAAAAGQAGPVVDGARPKAQADRP